MLNEKRCRRSSAEVGLVGSEVLEILRPPRCQHGAEHLGGAVVDQVAPGIRTRHLQTVREPAVQLQSEAVIPRIALWAERSNRSRESCRRKSRIDVRPCLQVTESVWEAGKRRCRGVLM